MTRPRRVLRRIGLILTGLLALLALAAAGLALSVYLLADVPAPDTLVINQTATLTYSDGSLLAQLPGVNRTLVPLTRVPEPVRWAVLAAEDRGFYSEPGVSVRGTLRAAVNDIRGGSNQGGSTITQQYVKNAYLNSDQTLSRKLKELAISLKLSRDYPKDQILEYYLNTIYFGRGAYGIQAGAQAYFGVDVDKLTVEQGAILAAVIKSPSYYDPRVTAGAARLRWAYVMDGLVITKRLTQVRRDAARYPETIVARAGSAALAGPLGLLEPQVRQELKRLVPNFQESEINARGLVIRTTIDKKAQIAAQAAITANFSKLTDLQRKQGLVPALTAVSPKTGAVLAYWGNPDGTKFDNANAYHPPGSSFKPYTLATALAQNLAGKKPGYAIDSRFDGSQQVIIEGVPIRNDPSDAPYASSSVRLDFAMKVSLNTVFDGLAAAVGPPAVADMAHAAGIRISDNDGKKTLVNAAGDTTFGIGIGDSDYKVRPLDQATGFATIANGGTEHDPFFVSRVTDAKGALVYQRGDGGDRAMDPRVANDVGLTLKPVADWSHDPLAGGRESGAKTGTEGIQQAPGVPPANVGQNSDAWMVGYTPQVSAAVWVGTAAAGPISNASGGQEYGADLPGKTWKMFMDAYLQGQPNLPLPSQQSIFANGPTAPQPSYVPSTPQTATAPTVAPTTGLPPAGPPTTVAPPVTPPPSPTSIFQAPVTQAPVAPATKPPAVAPAAKPPPAVAPAAKPPPAVAPAAKPPPAVAPAAKPPAVAPA